ncbi:LemA family protein [Halomonas sp. THAF5a]|uniref:LemA family protein n=1 Tax=Halomonas sp. THAF5a TaxID=2587844 RepID=UPI0012678DED|nr:LemA family protein [Halomonas sp. THAF5a]QFU02524.1 LemA family protein [Halomonas sp. THAF5a]
MSLSLIIPVALLGLLLVYGVAIYNRLVALKNRYQNAFAQIEVQLKRRHDLIPNLVETAKAYLRHERETLQAVTEARNAAEVGLRHAAARPGEPGPMAELAGAEGALGAALGRLNVVMEAYPDLKASDNMRELSETLATTENRVAFARQAYNDAAMQYNTYRQSFPPVLLAGSIGHKREAALLAFEDSAEIQAAPRVTF